MLCIISPYAAVYAHGAHRVGRHGARGKHLRHSCDLWAWWCCLRCYCWLGCQWRDGRRPLAPLQQRLLRRGKIRNSCPEPADTWPHICIYTTSVWAAQAKPRSSQLATVWLLAVVSHSWCTSSQEGRLNTIVRRREKSSICEIPRTTLSLELCEKARSRKGQPVCGVISRKLGVASSRRPVFGLRGRGVGTVGGGRTGGPGGGLGRRWGA